MISKLIPNLFSCPMHLHQILAPKIVDNEKSKKKLPSCMYDASYAHLVETNLKTQASSNMHEMLKEKVKKEFLYIFTKERYRTSSVGEFSSKRSVKDMHSTTNWKQLCCFAYVMKE